MEYTNGEYIESSELHLIHKCDYIIPKDLTKKHYSELLNKLNEELDKQDGRGVE